MPFAIDDYVKVEFRDEHSSEAEWMWVRVKRDDAEHRLVYGTLDSEPIVMTDLQLGQELAISYDHIRDHRTPASFQAT